LKKDTKARDDRRKELADKIDGWKGVIKQRKERIKDLKSRQRIFDEQEVESLLGRVTGLADYNPDAASREIRSAETEIETLERAINAGEIETSEIDSVNRREKEESLHPEHIERIAFYFDSLIATSDAYADVQEIFERRRELRGGNFHGLPIIAMNSGTRGFLDLADPHSHINAAARNLVSEGVLPADAPCLSRLSWRIK
jgi:hypothetical protein